MVTGVDLSQTADRSGAAELRAARPRPRDLRVANGEALPFPDASFDVVYGHGVLQYTADPRRIVAEATGC